MSISNISAVCFALFVFAGYFKAADSLRFMPVDLTLLFATGTAVFCGLEVWRRRALDTGMVPVLAVFLVLAVGFHWPEELTSYATQKELRLFSLTALSALAPFVILRTAPRRQAFAYTVCALGMLMAGVAVIEASWHGPSPRATVFNANPILLARVSGFAILVLCLLYWQGRLRVWLFAPAAGMASIGLLASGTKAPLLGLLLTVFAITPFFLMQSANRTRIWGTLLVGCAGLAATLAFLASAKFYFARRIAGALTGARGFTSDTRLTLWQLTLDMIPMHPLGLGWGRFSEWIRVFENGQLMRHPHNMALEIFLEAGWLAGAAFLALVAASLYRGLRAAYQDTARIGGSASPDLLLVLAGLMYWMVCAAFSGDVNDNRPFWALLGMALAALGSRRTAKADSVDGRVEARDG